MTKRLDPAEKRERFLRRLVEQMWAVVERAWDRQGLTPMQREARLRKGEAIIARIREQKRGH